MDIICSLCGQRCRGSSLIDPRDIGGIAALLLIHLIDEHWEIVERIRATTDDPAARDAFIREVMMS